MSCLAGSTYTMTADIYEPTTTRNETNGMVTKSWSLKETVSCYARGILGSQLGGNSAQVDLKDYLTLTKDFIKIRTTSPISSELRVIAIRNSDGIIWTEEYIQNTAGGLDGATIFEPSGTTPLIDYIGRVIEYETVLKRQEIQSLEVG
jgi:hypothetical protein